MAELKTSAGYVPTGDQPRAIEEITRSLQAGERYQTLLGATGTGKTATMAWIIEQIQRPALVIAHNKTLAAQLCNEFREFFPANAVEYFVSYYDYYQPEAYVPQADLYIEKDSLAERRHRPAPPRGDVEPALAPRHGHRRLRLLHLRPRLAGGVREAGRLPDRRRGDRPRRDAAEADRHPVRPQRHAARPRPLPGQGRRDRDPAGVLGDRLPRSRCSATRSSRSRHFDPLTGEVFAKLDTITVFPATQYVTSKPTIERAQDEIKHELEQQVALFESQGRMLEAHRIRQRTEYDLEMMRELGFCNGIENYSRILDGRPAGLGAAHAARLLPLRLRRLRGRVAPDGAADRRHVRGRPLAQADARRPRLPAPVRARQPAAPLRRVPGQGAAARLRLGDAGRRSSCATRSVVAEQLIRPTFLVDPEVELRPTKNQIDNLLSEIRRREEAGERVLVTTLTKKMSEDLTDYLLEAGVRARYLHSEIDTLERIQIIRELRLGEYDVLVGINLLREGLDLPEVSLVAILDADKEGFLRGKTALVQTIGRAARQLNGRVLLYADKMTEAIKGAMEETERRRAIQLAYNEEHGTTPISIVKGVSDIAEFLQLENPNVPGRRRRGARPTSKGCRARSSRSSRSRSRRRCSPPPRSCASSTRRSCATRSRTCGGSCSRSPRRRPRARQNFVPLKRSSGRFLSGSWAEDVNRGGRCRSSR